MHSSSIFHLPPTHAHTHWRICTHTLQPPTGVRESTGRSAARKIACFWMTGRSWRQAAACPTAPSGAENQDNFIVIISLLCSPSLSFVEEEEKKVGRHEGEVRQGGGWARNKNKEKLCVSRLAGCSGRSWEDTSVLLFYMFIFCREDCRFSPKSQHLISPPLQVLIFPGIMFQLIRSGFLKP